MTALSSLPALLQRSRVIAIVRGGDAARVLPVCETLVEGGVLCLEVTTNTPGWEDAVAALSARDDLLVGTGTVLTPEHVAESHAAGASFVVSPNTDFAVGAAAAELGMDWYPGAVTPTEIMAAWRAGATAVKVFPASSMGGPDYLKQVRAPLPDIPLIPTGGVGLDMMDDYFKAGAVALGIGSPLIGDALTGGSLDALLERARRASQIVRNDV